jgi:hypothetical protein
MLLKGLGVVTVLFIAIVAYLIFMRGRLDRFMTRDWVELRPAPARETFDPKMVGDLPEPARRYLIRAIQPGTRLAGSVYLEMEGKIGLQPGGEKLPLRAQEILAAPGGLIWKASVGSGFMRISGYDFYRKGEGGMRWFLWGVIPVMSAQGSDITRSAAGRVAMEALAWLPSILVLHNEVRWEAIDDRSARVYLRVGDEETESVIHVSPDGALERVEVMRWEVDGLNGSPEYLRSVAEVLGEEGEFEGYRIPTRILLTSKVGTPQENPFFEATVLSAGYQ